MKIRARRLIVVLFTLVFAASVFAVTAFAAETSSAITPVDPASEPASQVTSSEAAPSSTAESSSAVSSKPAASSSKAPVSSRSSSVSSRHASSSQPTRSVDTQTSRVEAMASQAAAAVSDPNVLSSQDWGELLSSGSDSAVPAGGTVSDTSSANSAATSNGGVSWLLILGVALIVVALCGIGFFVYAQFLSNRGGHGSNHGPMDISSRSGGAPDPKDDTRPMDFEDISSDSDGTQHRGGYVPNSGKPLGNIRPAGTVTRAPAASPAVKEPAAPKPETPKPEVKKPESSVKEITAPVEQADLPKREPPVPTQELTATPKSQATPVQGSKDFDWEKFFNDEQ